MRVAGKPPIKVLKLPSKCRVGPMIMNDIGFIISPGVSPILIGTMVIKLWLGIASVSTLNWEGIAVIGTEIFGYGMGMGIGPTGVGIGVKQISGNAKFIPHICVFAKTMSAPTSPCECVRRRFLHRREL